MKLIFEKSVKGRHTDILPSPKSNAGKWLPKNLLNEELPDLPELSELDVVRHFTELSRRNAGVDTAFYPLGSCTMKYNPKVNEAIASNQQFTNIHPLSPDLSHQGTLHFMYDFSKLLSELCGMAEFSLHPMAGAHGEFAGLAMIKAYHASMQDTKRTAALVPDSSHGTNLATASMAGYKVKNIKSREDGEVDIEDLKKHLGDDTAVLMLTNPSTLGLFETQILEIADIVHSAGGLLYYDGANMNAIAGKVRPGDMGFDVVHLNIHKTFSAPHGGGGPGCGAVGVSERIVPFLPNPRVVKNDDGIFSWSSDFPNSIGRVSGFYGNVLVALKGYLYLRSLGASGIREMSEHAVLAANYLRVKQAKHFPAAKDRFCMHEFVAQPSPELRNHRIRAMDIAKCLIDRGIHPPTVYFPLIVQEALMIEPTETESLQTLDDFIEVMNSIAGQCLSNPESAFAAPEHMPVTRLDEAKAARELKLVYKQ